MHWVSRTRRHDEVTMADENLGIMLVTTSITRGGAETQVFLLARELRARGHRVQVVSLRDAEAYEDELAEMDVPFFSLGMRRGQPDPRAVFRLAGYVRRYRPHIVHSHMVHANLLARVARPLAWMPVQISTAHNLTEGGRSRDVAYRATDALATLTTNVCRDCVERFVRIGAVPRRKIRYMPNGLDVASFRADPAARERIRSELGIGDRFLWLAVGRLEPQKDYPTMLQAIPWARESRPDMVVAIVSDGPLRDELKRMRSDLGLAPEQVRFLGHRADVPEVMSAADAYLMSSAWEGLPMVLLEASAAGLPIVATDVGGNREVVRHERTGLLVRSGDPAALAHAMVRTIDLPREGRRAWGESARRHVEATFHIDRIVERWEVLYRNLLAGTPEA